MPLIAVSNVCFSIGQAVILDGATLSIEPGERIGLVGRNGAGKSTLMRVMTGELTPDSGSVILQRGSRVGYLKQDPDLDAELTLREEAGKAFVELSRLHKELDEVYHAMERLPPDDAEGGVTLDRLMKRQSDIQHRIEDAGGYAVDHKIDAILHGLGFVDSQFGIKVSGLSGGQMGRLALAKLLLESPDLLLLDEPTNHLDISGREWLEDFLSGEFRGAVLMVSHDRYMLDRVVTRIEEVEQGRLIDYPGNYSAFCEIRYHRRLTQHRAYAKQQNKFKKEEEYIRKYKAGQRAKQAQGRLSKLDREKRDSTLERPVELESFRMELPKAPRAGDLVAVVRGAGKWYGPADGAQGAGGEEEPGQRSKGGRVLFRDLDVTISREERWGIIGPNGAGKTTLVRAMLGQMPLSAGTARLGANVIVGYYSQTGDDADESLPVYQYLQLIIRRENPGGVGLSEQQARDLAGAFLFSGKDQEKRIGSLSGGERSRARLAGLLASAKNLLVLDEPTNHLDIQSAERLEDALCGVEGEDGEREGGFDGTALLISHDRALIDATCDHLLVLDGAGGVEVFHGNYSEWHEKHLARLKSDNAAANDKREGEKREAERRESEKREAERREAQKREAKQRDATQRAGAAVKKERAVVRVAASPADRARGSGGVAKSVFSWMSEERLEKEIAVASARVVEVDGLLGDEKVYSDAKRCRDLLGERAEVKEKLDRMEEEWLRRAGK